MARMLSDANPTGFMRCPCGHRLKVVDGRGQCSKCGATATAILSTRWRTCALAGCEREFLPSGPDQRTCCPEHRTEYARQQQRERLARKRGASRIERMRVELREDREPLGTRSAPQTKHVCAGYPGHTCTVRTADRRCPKCRAMWKAMHGVTGSYDPSMPLSSAIDSCQFL